MVQTVRLLWKRPGTEQAIKGIAADLADEFLIAGIFIDRQLRTVHGCEDQGQRLPAEQVPKPTLPASADRKPPCIIACTASTRPGYRRLRPRSSDNPGRQQRYRCRHSRAHRYRPGGWRH